MHLYTSFINIEPPCQNEDICNTMSILSFSGENKRLSKHQIILQLYSMQEIQNRS